MHLYLSIAFTLLAGIAGMYLLAKAKAESLGKFYVIVSYSVILIAGLSLLCQLIGAVCNLSCHRGMCASTEHCMSGMQMHGMSGACGMNSMCGDRETCCSMKGCGEGKEHDKMECSGMSMDEHGKCEGEMKEGEEGHVHGMQHDGMMRKDSAIVK